MTRQLWPLAQSPVDLDDPRLGQFSQALGECLGHDAPQAGHEIGEAAGPAEQVAHYE